MQLPQQNKYREAIMIKIVSYTKYNDEVFFFVQDKEKALTAQEAEVLVNNGFTNISKELFSNIIDF